MKKRITILLTILLAASLAACSSQATTASESVIQVATQSDSVVTTTNSSATQAVSIRDTEGVTSEILKNTHEESSDYTWDTADEISIQLDGSTASSDNAGVDTSGSVVTISAGGTYRISGSLSDGHIIVNSKDDQVVRLILDGVDITSSNSAPIYVADAQKVIVILAENSQNTLTDGSNYLFADSAAEEPDSALFSKADLTIYGSGELTVNANFNDGITSKDGLIIASGTVEVNAVDDGICGKDYVVIKEASITISATGDGIKSDNEEDAALGYILIESGNLSVTAGGDAITAQTSVIVNDGSLTLASGGGSGASINDGLSAKGIKGLVSVTINGGSFTINSADDSVHSNGEIVINNGTFQLASGDDGMHADDSLTINGGDIVISESYEGIESALITINAGNIHLIASDDGINVASGNDGSGGMFGGMQDGPGQDMFYTGGDYYLYINGGYIYVNADGDGIDSNGNIEMTDGVVLVNGPTNNGNGALDFANFSISGGFIIAVGSSGMAQALSVDSTQNSVLYNLDSAVQAGTVVNIQDSRGNTLFTFVPVKTYQSILFSSSNLLTGSDYSINIGGNVTGDVVDGMVINGVYSSGSQSTSFSVSSVVTTLGAVGFGQGGMPGGGGGGHRH